MDEIFPFDVIEIHLPLQKNKNSVRRMRFATHRKDASSVASNAGVMRRNSNRGFIAALKWPLQVGWSEIVERRGWVETHNGQSLRAAFRRIIL
ncbi:hypothetical protein [Methylocystis sp.]|uniref:hypothetical protein n=1 Tax=Methylocystis sp. TaxID=1911079 RepID=UPI003D0FDF40